MPNQLIHIPDLPTRPKWWDEPCTKLQRESIDLLRLRAKNNWSTFEKVVMKVVGVQITGSMRLTKKQANEIIGYYTRLTGRG